MRILITNKVLAIFIFLSLGTILRAQNVHLAGAREAGIANSSLTLGGTWTTFHNPAGLATTNNYCVGINYLNRFQTAELSTRSITGTIPTSNGGFGAGYSYFGTSSYNQQKLALGYAHKLSDKIEAGILFDLFSANLPNEYESAYALTGELGLTIRPINNLSIGAHINNITGANYTQYEYEELPMSFRSSLTWQTDNYLLSGLLSLNRDGEPVISIGSEVTLLSNFDVRLGVSTHEAYNFSLGAGYHKTMWHTDIAFSRHPNLGYTSMLSAGINFGETK